MINIETIEEMLIRHEGIKFTPYRCTAGRLTIGCGRSLDTKGITKDEAMFLLKNDIEECTRDLAISLFRGKFWDFPGAIQRVLISMRFQLGYGGFRGFKKMIAAVKDDDWREMIVQMQESNWYKQTTNRANDLIEMVRECI